MESLDAVRSVFAIGTQWPTLDPFLFCAHHVDNYPRGNGQLGPRDSLAGREIGADFSNRDGWSMYHGRSIPGFPRHPHRGFETLTFCRRGTIDHADSLGATARFGAGDAQWLTAGRGIEHAEMFPLRSEERTNPLELFQIWLNLPQASKMVVPSFSMFWSDALSPIEVEEARVTVIAGELFSRRAPQAPPNSWASHPEHEVAVVQIELAAHARLVVPPTIDRRTARVLYFFEGDNATIDGYAIKTKHGAHVQSDAPIELAAGEAGVCILMLQGRPIGEPVVQYGPFVMNDRAGIEGAFDDYRSGAFGRWPWSDDAPVHSADANRFAVHPDGRRDEPHIATLVP